MRSLRAAAKFLRVIAWVLRGYWMVRITFPQRNDAQQARAVEVWARGMLAIIGIEVRVKGHPAPGPVLMAANHISWLDILVMHAACHCRFVAKSEIRSWPLVGVLTTGGGSLYIERGSRHDAMRVVHQMADALKQGHVLAVFPEGGLAMASRCCRFMPTYCKLQFRLMRRSSPSLCSSLMRRPMR